MIKKKISPSIELANCVIIHCLEVSCKEDQIKSAQRESDLSSHNWPTNSELLLAQELIYFDSHKQ